MNRPLVGNLLLRGGGGIHTLTVYTSWWCDERWESIEVGFNIMKEIDNGLGGVCVVDPHMGLFVMFDAWDDGKVNCSVQGFIWIWCFQGIYGTLLVEMVVY